MKDDERNIDIAHRSGNNYVDDVPLCIFRVRIETQLIHYPTGQNRDTQTETIWCDLIENEGTMVCLSYYSRLNLEKSTRGINFTAELI